MVTRLDPVASRLASAENVEPTLVLDWLEGRQQRNALHRRTFWCSLGAWMLVTAAAVIGSAVAIKFAHDTREAFADVTIWSSGWNYDYKIVHPPIAIQVVPPLLALVAAILLIGGLVAWCLGRFPGHSWTSSAIDWSNVSDAVWRLLSVGCTYPESFETAAKVSRCGSNRLWLRQSAEQVQRGASEFPSGKASNGDVAMLQTLVQTSDAQPSARWRLAQEYFGEVAQRRVALLQATVPIVSTLVAGLLIWLSISATLGWMWATVGRMMTGFDL